MPLRTEQDSISANKYRYTRRFATLALGCCGIALASSCRALFALDEEADRNVDERWWIQERGECTVVSRPTRELARLAAMRDSRSLDQPIYLALQELRIGTLTETLDEWPSTTNEQLWQTEGPWRDIGFDLDGRCTLSACARDELREKSCAKGSAPDGNGCRDNQIGSIMRLARRTVLGLDELSFNCELATGGFNVLLRISEYNGSDNDPEVRIDVYTSTGKTTTRSSYCHDSSGMLDPGWKLALKWWSQQWSGDFFGDTTWWVARESFAPAGSSCAGRAPDALPNSKVCDTRAFVKNGYISASFLDRGEGGAEFWLNARNTGKHEMAPGVQLSPGFRMQLLSASVVGKLSTNGEIWTLDPVTLGGVTDYARITQSFGEIGFCDASCPALFDAAGSVLVQDTLSQGQPSELAQCDGISVGWAFKAHQTGVGVIEDLPSSEPRRVPQLFEDCQPGDARLCWEE